jgi:hypothetical protein
LLDRPALNQLRADLKTDLFDAAHFLAADRIACVVAYNCIYCCVCSRRLSCRFSDAGMAGVSTRSGGPASEKRQGTKSRDVGGGSAAGCYGDLATRSGAPVMTRSGSETHFAK